MYAPHQPANYVPQLQVPPAWHSHAVHEPIFQVCVMKHTGALMLWINQSSTVTGTYRQCDAAIRAHTSGTLRKMRQNLGWAIGYNAVALPIAAGVFEPAFGLVLRPEIAALSMSGSSFLVAVNALLLKRLRLPSPSRRAPNG